MCLLVFLASMGLFALARQPWVPEDAIGFAQGTTGIQVAGGFGLSPLLLALAGLALVLAVFFLWRLARRKKGERGKRKQLSWGWLSHLWSCSIVPRHLRRSASRTALGI